jgi:hypothetical protein
MGLRELLVFSFLASLSMVKGAIDILRDAGWVREQPIEPGPSGGRRTIRYQVNPKVWE